MRKLHAQGMTRNDIARDIGRSPSTVSKIARGLGLSFDRSATAAATAAKQRDNKARRADIVARLYVRVERILDRLEAPEYRFTATSVNGIETRTLDHVPGQEEKALSGAISGNLGAAARLEQIDAHKGADDAHSMLGQLAAGLQAAYDQLPTQGAQTVDQVPDP